MNKRLTTSIILILVIPAVLVGILAILNIFFGYPHLTMAKALLTPEGSRAYDVCSKLNLIELGFIFVTVVYMSFHLASFKNSRILTGFFLYFFAAFFYVFAKDDFSFANFYLTSGNSAQLIMKSIAIPLYTAAIAHLCYRIFPDIFPVKAAFIIEFFQMLPIISALSFKSIPVLSYFADFLLILPLVPCMYAFAIAFEREEKFSLRFGICLFLAEADLLLRSDFTGLSIPLRYACLPAIGAFMILNVIMMADKFNSQQALEKYYTNELNHYLNALQTSENAFLNAQIKPHFLYNTLNTIADLCVTDPEKAKGLIDSLTEYLKLILELDNTEEQVPLRRELQLADAYIAIEKERFPNINFYKDFPFKLPEVSLPALTIQPLIENAIKHGVRKSNRPGAVTLRIIESEDGVYFYVSDNGVGMNEETIENLFREPKDNKSIGIYNIDKRLKNQYNAGLSVDSTIDLGTCVSFKVPNPATGSK